jgi:hypothetical protein
MKVIMVDENYNEVSLPSFKKSASIWMPDSEEIKVRIGKVQHVRTGRQFYCIGVNAKMLAEDYLRGITMENVERVYEYTQKIPYGLRFSPESFMNGRIFDTDFCYDGDAGSQKAWHDLMKGIDMKSPEPKVEKTIYQKDPVDKGLYTGIEFNKRESATPKKPYVKYYDKTLDIQSRPEQFRTMFNPEEIANLPRIGRMEVTLKNRKSWINNGLIYPNSFGELLERMESKREELTNFALSRTQEAYIDKMTRIGRKTQMTATEHMRLELVTALIDSGRADMGIEMIVKRFMYESGRDTRDSSVRRYRKELMAVFRELKADKAELVKHSEQVEKLMSQFGLEF